MIYQHVAKRNPQSHARTGAKLGKVHSHFINNWKDWKTNRLLGRKLVAMQIGARASSLAGHWVYEGKGGRGFKDTEFTKLRLNTAARLCNP